MTTFFARAGAALLAFPILVLLQAPNGNANRGGDGGSESAAETSCADKTTTFPTPAYTRMSMGSKGAVSGFEIHLSSLDGDCSTLFYASNTAKEELSLNVFQRRDDDLFALR
jgi:hypothetical protein